MYKSIYITSAEPHTGSLVVAIGLMEMLKGHYKRVAFFRPIVPEGENAQYDIDVMLKHFKLDMTYDACCGFTVSEYIKADANDTLQDLFEGLIQKVNHLKEMYDFVLIEGYSTEAYTSFFDFDFNLKIAKNLNTAFIPILQAKGKTSDEIFSEMHIISETIKEEKCMHLLTFINRCDEKILGEIKERISDEPRQIYLLPEVEELNTPTLHEVILCLHAKLIMGNPEQLQRLVSRNFIATMGVENYLSHIKNADLVIVSGDRSDIIVASLLSFYAKNHANIAGIILCDGVLPSDSLVQLLNDFSKITIPILSVESESVETVLALAHITAQITAKSTQKIALALGLFDTYVDKKEIIQRLKEHSSDITTPIMFQYRLFERARSERKKIILPESNDERILRATEIILRRDIADIILLGEEKTIMHQSRLLGLDISKATIIDPQDSIEQERFSQLLYTLRKEKGLTLAVAKDMMTHSNYFATMMVYKGLADGLVAGATQTTADTVRPALEIIKTRPGISIVSSVFFMCLETEVLVYGDCAINLDPKAEELAHIAISSADTAAQFGVEPCVAMLSYSTGASGEGPDVEKVRQATKLARSLRPDLPIEGPIQYDAAVDKSVAAQKMPESKVAGKATVFIFPDLNTGNNTYKAVQRSTGALAIGPILQGLNLPVNDLSRGCMVDDIVNTVAITAIQAQKEN